MLTWPPVKTARSCKLDFLFSPNPGAFTAQTCKVKFKYEEQSRATSSTITLKRKTLQHKGK